MQDEKNNSDVTNEALDGDECNDDGGKSENHIDEIFKKVLIVKISKTIDSIFFSFFCSSLFFPPCSSKCSIALASPLVLSTALEHNDD